MTLPGGIKAFVFDVFGTVVDWRSGVAREAGPFLQRHGRGDIDAGAFADAWRARYSPAMEEVRSGRRPFVRLDVLHRENLEALLASYGLKSATPQELEGLNTVWHRLDPWPDAVPGLARMKARAIIAPLSNGNIALMVNMAKRAGLPWDVILGAEVSQAYKPTPQAYLRAAEALALEPHELCLVACHPSDLAAARGCGLRTCFVPRPLENGPVAAARYSAKDDDADATAEDFGMLADLAGA